ncbi:hypothetical protein SAMN05444354_112130 [Stigmatella aurantiaca]|uniref:Immunity protein 52 domain-containing protein n=1 Tax=Stigmatella aurantiaca TaxID=41 RepID=A0A1H7W3E3_STIAU|nr:DUF5953 family protein [Stigmatella aurantiaca]SEM15834.1 hypothetical protein SAMN05444354_112130 [Stigmatella aurantiaca]
MSGAPDFIGIIVYAPALVPGDNRPLAVVRGLEGAFPGLRLDWTISDEGKLVQLPLRDAWVGQEMPEGEGFPLVCNGDEGFRVTLHGMGISARSGPGGHPLFDVHAHLPSDAAGIAAAANSLEAIAECSQALWGHATPFKAGVEVSRQIVHSQRKPGVPPRGLPGLKLREDIRSPEIPHHLGWLNYWSAAAARAIGFPDPVRDSDLHLRVRRATMGGWIVQLTDSPLDLDNPVHLDALRRTYERFPEIGGRSAT